MSVTEIVLLVWACVASGMATYYRADSLFFMKRFMEITSGVIDIAEGKAKAVINQTTGKIDLVRGEFK